MATTINSYSVSLALDAKDYIKNSALSRSETSSLTRQINQARTPADKYERSVKLLDKALKSGTITQDTYNKLLAKQTDLLDKAAKKTSSLADGAKRLFLAYVSIRGLTSVVGGGIKLAADAQDAQIQFEVLLKSATKAEEVLSKIRQFSASTAFQFPELRDAGRMLLAFGFSADEVLPTLRMLGNIADGTGSRIGELAELFGKARVQQTLYSEDINQLTGRGINVIGRLADRLRIGEDEVKKFASEGKLQFSDLLAVMQDLAETDFLGMMEKRSKGLNGQWSTLHDNMATIQQDLGEGLLPLMGKLAEKGTEWARSFKQGMNVITSGKTAQDILEAEQAATDMASQNAWLEESLRRKRAGLATLRTSPDRNAERTMSGLQSLDPIGFGKGVMQGLSGGGKGIADQFTGLFNQVSTAVMWSGEMTAEKVVAAVSEDPAIASLEAGTQEAYSFLTQGMKEASSAQKILVEEQKKLVAEERKNQEKNYRLWENIYAVLQANGFAKARN